MTPIQSLLTKLKSNAGRDACYKRIHIFLFCLLCSLWGFSQESSGFSKFKDKLFFGGGLGANFGTQTFISLTPVAGYNITKRWQAGVGATYQYYSYRDLNFQTSLYGGSVFTRYFILRDLFAVAETEALNGQFQVNGERSTAVNVNVGGGYVARLGGVAGLVITGLYNLNANSPMFTPAPFINIGFIYGLPQ